MPRGSWGKRDERKYKKILKSCRKTGKKRTTCERIAAATVNKGLAARSGGCVCPRGYNKIKGRGGKPVCQKRGKKKGVGKGRLQCRVPGAARPRKLRGLGQDMVEHSGTKHTPHGGGGTIPAPAFRPSFVHPQPFQRGGVVAPTDFRRFRGLGQGDDEGIVLSTETTRLLEPWHGGQWSATYSLLSTSVAGRAATTEQVDEAIGELESTRSKLRGRGSRAHKRELDQLIGNLEVAKYEGFGGLGGR